MIQFTLAVLIALAGAIVGMLFGKRIEKPDKISWQQGYNAGWREAKAMFNKKDAAKEQKQE